VVVELVVEVQWGGRARACGGNQVRPATITCPVPRPGGC